MPKRGFPLFFAVCVICVSILLYNVKDLIFIQQEKNESSAYSNPFLSIEEGEKAESEASLPKVEENSSNGQTAEKPETESQSSQTSVQAGTEAVKGKIISNYISPYNAPLSYNGVYMKNSTGKTVDIKSLLTANLGFKIEKNDQPQVLIMHTHTTESFMNEDSEYYTADFQSRSTDNSKNMVKIGNIVTEKLNQAGIKTLHDTTQHDYPQYNGSYTRSAKTVKSYLEKYPSIKVVLDLHRDAVSSGESDKVKLVTEIEGKKAAQVMVVMGSETGSVTNHPKWQENLKLALKFQQLLEIKYPTLARPLSLVSSKYNQNLTTGSMLIEFGTDANSFDEVCYTAELVGNTLTALFNSLG